MTKNKQIIKLIRYLFAAVALAFLQGCLSVPVPIPTPASERPYNKGKIGFIETNITTKDEVIARFGSPSVKRRDGAIFLYQTDATVLVEHDWLITPIGVFHDSYDVKKLFNLLVEFNSDNTVKAAEALSSSDKRSRSGFSIYVDSCLRKVILFDTPEEDELAKRFEPAAKSTVIYVYWDNVKGDNVKGFIKLFNSFLDKFLYTEGYVSIDKRQTEFINEKGFFRWEVLPGNHQIQANRYFDEFLNLRCEEGQIYFIRLKTLYTARIASAEEELHNRVNHTYLRYFGGFDMTSSGIFDGEVEVSVVDHEEGRREISKRKLILL